MWSGSHLLWVNLHQLAQCAMLQCPPQCPRLCPWCIARAGSSQAALMSTDSPGSIFSQSATNVENIVKSCQDRGPGCTLHTLQEIVHSEVCQCNYYLVQFGHQRRGNTQKWENGLWHLFNFSSGKCNANNNLRESLQIDLQFPRPKSTNLGCKRISKYLEASHHLQY